MNDNYKIKMLNPTGRVVDVYARMKDQLIKQGFKMIVNPREEYYPSHDKQNSGYWKDQNVIENIQIDNFLEVDKL